MGFLDPTELKRANEYFKNNLYDPVAMSNAGIIYYAIY